MGDVYPELATYRHSRGISCLDRGLVPDSLINSSKLHATASVLTSHVANGHDIVKVKVSVRLNVLNDTRHPKHEVIPSGVFMPGKDGTPVTSTSELQSLVRLLHREHGRLYSQWGIVSHVLRLLALLLLSQDAVVLMTRRVHCLSHALGQAPLRILGLICQLLVAFGHGGGLSCHHNFTPTSDRIAEHGSTSVLEPSG